MRVALDGKQPREVSFGLRQYGSVWYGYAATVHKAQGATVERTFVLATPGIDRHLAYVGMTRHREEATLYAGNDDFKSFDSLKERLSRARAKDTTLDYAQRRGLQGPAEPYHGLNERNAAGETEPDQSPIDRFRQAQSEFIKVRRTLRSRSRRKGPRSGVAARDELGSRGNLQKLRFDGGGRACWKRGSSEEPRSRESARALEGQTLRSGAVKISEYPNRRVGIGE
jgi:hypothetical protein